MSKLKYQRCAVPSCINQHENVSGITFHRFPRNTSLRFLWLSKINNGDLAHRNINSIRSNYAVCGRHFETHQFQTPERKKLNRGVVPVLYLNENDHPTFSDSRMDQLEKTHCICHYCPTKQGDKGVSLFRLPKEPKSARRWLEACNREDLMSKDPDELYNNYRLCERHFENKYFFPRINDDEGKQLLDQALPTIFQCDTNKVYKEEKDSGDELIEEITITDEVTSQTSDDANGHEDVESAITTNSQFTNSSTMKPGFIRKFKSSFVHDICRTCLCQISPSKSASIFANREFFDSFSKIVSIHISQNDMLPKNLCLKCIDHIKAAASFGKSAEAANEILKQKLRIAMSQNVQTVEDRLDLFCDEIFHLSQGMKERNQINENYNDYCITAKESIDRNGRDDNMTILSKSDDQVSIELDQYEEVTFSNFEKMESLDVSSKSNGSFQEGLIIENQQIEADVNLVSIENHKDDKHLSNTQALPEISLLYNLLKHPVTNNSSTESFGNRAGPSLSNQKIIIMPFRSLHSISELKRRINLVSNSNSTFLQNRKLGKSLAKKASNKIFKCRICGKTYHKKASITNHMKSHLIRYTCEYCGNSFNQKETFKLHLVKVYKHISKSNLCYICGKTVSDISSHIKVHNIKKTIECPFEGCDTFVKYKSTLASHIQRIHTKQTVCMCEQCGQQFSTTDALRIHLSNHTAERRFKCETCDVEFVYRSRFKSHLLSHCQGKSFECPVCLAKFTAKSSIKKHCVTHHPEHPLGANPPAHLKKGYVCTNPLQKIHKCSYCSKRFSREFYLKMHLKNHYESE